jgi:cell division protein ZapA
MNVVKISVGAKSFDVNCPIGQEMALRHASEHLSIRFNEIQQNASHLPYEQILALAAINAIVAFQQKNDEFKANDDHAVKRLKRMAELFDQLTYADLP